MHEPCVTIKRQIIYQLLQSKQFNLKSNNTTIDKQTKVTHQTTKNAPHPLLPPKPKKQQQHQQQQKTHKKKPHKIKNPTKKPPKIPRDIQTAKDYSNMLLALLYKCIILNYVYVFPSTLDNRFHSDILHVYFGMNLLKKDNFRNKRSPGKH